MKFFTTRLLEARVRAGFASQSHAARELNLPQQTYGNYESGRSFPKEDILLKIAVTFGVSIDWLLGLDTPERQNASMANSVRIKTEAMKKHASTVLEKAGELIKSLEDLEKAT